MGLQGTISKCLHVASVRRTSGAEVLALDVGVVVLLCFHVIVSQFVFECRESGGLMGHSGGKETLRLGKKRTLYSGIKKISREQQ